MPRTRVAVFARSLMRLFPLPPTPLPSNKDLKDPQEMLRGKRGRSSRCTITSSSRAAKFGWTTTPTAGRSLTIPGGLSLKAAT